jgi:hypothetical protein
MTVELLANQDGPGITVVDRIEGRRFPLSTPEPVALDGDAADRFRDPVGATASCTVGEIELPHVIGVFVRDADGRMVAECHDFASQELPDGEYELEIAAPIKIFLRVSGPVTVTSSNVDMHLSFGGDRRIDVGARSYHERPAGTVTTTADPEDLMAAVSTFGSALKTTSPERSFPLLRGHPPAIELGEELAVPDAVAPPDTGLWIEVPREREAVYAVATLAHYLGARVRAGERARLVADGSVLRVLDGPDGLEGAVTETLQHVFLLDCVARTQGRYRLDLHERQRLEGAVDLPLADLYDAPIAERVARYLDVPTDAVADQVPNWYLSTHLSPAPESAELLPYAANALSLVSVERPGYTGAQPAPPGYETFVRDSESSTASPAAADDYRYVRVSETDALEQAWAGEGRAVNANDLQLSGVRNRFDSESTDGAIDIAMVCNDERMVAEVGEGELYGDREELPFDVTIHENLSRAALRELFASDLDVLHYVGHVDQAGIRCRDGSLDAAALTTVGVKTFFLNGCRSYEQGQELVDAGSVGGIVTHGAVDNSNATRVGRLVAGLLNAGFSLRSALSVAGRGETVEGRYAVVGDGAVQIAQSENGTPNLLHVSRRPTDDEYEVRITTYPTVGLAMGACYTPYAPTVDRYFLVGGELPPIRLSLPEVVNLLALERVPVVIDGEFRWSTDVAPGDLP